MDLTNSYKKDLQGLIGKYTFSEVRNAAGVIASACPNEWKELLTILNEFSLRTEDLMLPGGSKSLVVKYLENMFYSRGWTETRVDTEQIVYKVPKVTKEKIPKKLVGLSTSERLNIQAKHSHIEVFPTFQEGYLIDALKGRLAVDIEWNAKDGNLDRDILAYRSWYDLGIIDGAVLITKQMVSCRTLVHDIWCSYGKQDAKYTNKNPPVDLGTTTTTSIEKAEERIKRGDGGGCPILLIGITNGCWDKTPLCNASNLSEILAKVK